MSYQKTDRGRLLRFLDCCCDIFSGSTITYKAEEHPNPEELVLLGYDPICYSVENSFLIYNAIDGDQITQLWLVDEIKHYSETMDNPPSEEYRNIQSTNFLALAVRKLFNRYAARTIDEQLIQACNEDA